MQDFSIPVCYFPTTVLFIDDHRDFLLNIVLHLDENLSYRVVTSPFEALTALEKKRCEAAVLRRQCMKAYKEVQPGIERSRSAQGDLATVYAEIYNPQRFDEISVVIVDHAMTGMDGVRLCQTIADSSLKKILLIESSDLPIAKEAQEKGIIHQYVIKNEVNAGELLVEAIHSLQHQYFQLMSSGIATALAMELPRCLYDKKFITFFKQQCEQHAIVEYYLMDSSGSFLMLDDDARVTGLVLKNTADCKLYGRLAREQGVRPELVSQIEKGEMLPPFFHRDWVNDAWFHWTMGLLPATRLEAEETYFYSLVHGEMLFDVYTKKIQSYRRHLDELDVEELFR
jgi:CheY-like chemotaxis protein